MVEFEVEGHKYKADKLDGRVQFHITRRLAPVLESFESINFEGVADELAAVATDEAAGVDVADDETLPKNIIRVAGAFIKAIGKMEEKDCDYVLDRCLEVTMRSDDGGQSYFPIWNATTRKPQINLSMLEQMMIARYVIQDSLASFFNALRVQFGQRFSGAL
jgi:hypothetical protein